MYVLGIDPDLHRTGWAVVSDGSDEGPGIVSAGVLSVPRKLRGMDAVEAMIDAVVTASGGVWSELIPDHVVIESQHYIDRRSAVKIQDILNLALVSGAAGACMADALWNPGWSFASPLTWTKGMPKKTRHNRHRVIDFKMTDAELASVARCPESALIHVWDAAGMALWWLATGRCEA